jgi:ParB/RepB/Spo0J family partition protein
VGKRTETLANSMRELGQLQPIVVCPNPRIGYTLIAGRHRLEAALKLEWETIRAEVRTDVKGEDIVLAEIDENLARGELTPRREGDAYREAERDLRSSAS